MGLCVECGVNPVTAPGGECTDCQRQELREGIVAVGTALEKLCCAVERDLNADASESAPCADPEWAAVHERLAILADECMRALDHSAVSAVMENSAERTY